MATITQNKARALYTISGNSPKILYFPEGISQTFKKGALLYLTASGTCKVMVSGAGGGTGFDTLRKRILGIALADATNTTSPSTTSGFIPVHIADSDTVFLCNAISRTSTAVSTLALLDIGKAGGCSVNSSRFYWERSSVATNTVTRCLGLVDNVGDTYGRVLVQFLPGAKVFA